MHRLLTALVVVLLLVLLYVTLSNWDSLSSEHLVLHAVSAVALAGLGYYVWNSKKLRSMGGMNPFAQVNNNAAGLSSSSSSASTTVQASAPLMAADDEPMPLPKV